MGEGDFDGDGAVDVLNDGFILVRNLGKTVVPPPTASTAIAAEAISDSQAEPLASNPQVNAPVNTPVNAEPLANLLIASDSEDSRKEEANRVKTAAVQRDDVLDLAGSESLDEAFAEGFLI